MTRKRWLIFLAIATTLWGGWITSTRHIDVQFSANGETLSNCDIKVQMRGRQGQSPPKADITLDDSGAVRFPSKFDKYLAVFQISKNGQVIAKNFTFTLQTGRTKFDLIENSEIPKILQNPDSQKNSTVDSVVSEHHYRFFWFSKTNESETWILPDLDVDLEKE